jgi:ATPase subunit of ABC transporter with duplicated ATPase domains
MEKQVERLKRARPSSPPARRGVWRCAATPCGPTVCWRWTTAGPPGAGIAALFTAGLARLRSGDRVAIMGRNGGGKSSLLRLLWRQMQQAAPDAGLRLHPRLHPGYYDQTLHQLADNATLLDALEPSNPLANAKRALISAGFGWAVTGKRSAPQRRRAFAPAVCRPVAGPLQPAAAG